MQVGYKKFCGFRPIIRYISSNAGGVGRNRDSKPAVNAATGQVLSTRSPVDHGHRPASCDTSLVVSGGVDCARKRRNHHHKRTD